MTRSPLQTLCAQTGPMGNNSYVVLDPAARQCVLVDPSFECRELLRLVPPGVRVLAILLTHGHFDHAAGAADAASATNAPVLLHPADLPLLQSAGQLALSFGLRMPPAPEPAGWLEDGQRIDVGGGCLEVRHTPGHSPGGVTLVGDGFAIVGDCLFAGSIGRTDLPGAHHATLLLSIQQRILTLPEGTRLLPGHGPETTVRREKLMNPFLAGRG